MLSTSTTMVSAERIASVVLAAGASRSVRPKQLLGFHGETLIRRAARQALGACELVYVVVGAQGEASAAALEGLPVKVVVNRRWQDGLGSSVACGVTAVVRDADGSAAEGLPLDGVLLTLADQPLVTAEHLRAMIARFRGGDGRPLAALYDGVIGVPALFGIRWAGLLGSLPSDDGARRLLALLAGDVQRFELPEAAFDIDVEADYATLLDG